MAAKKDKIFDGTIRGKIGDVEGANMDERRRRNIAYEYLCHLEEARNWMGACLHETLPTASDMENCLRNGVILVKLARFFSPENVSEKHIYDLDEGIFKVRGLVFRHTDNITQWLSAMRAKKFPEIFFPETTDIYDKKNMPRVIYCLHALSKYLFILGIGVEMEDLNGVAVFTEEEISAMDAELGKAGIQMPKFGKIGGILMKEIGTDAASLHAAILAINACIEKEEPAQVLLGLLNSLNAGIANVQTDVSEHYRVACIAARSAKIVNVDIKSLEDDVYNTNMNATEIQKVISLCNMHFALHEKEKKIADALLAINICVSQQV